MKIPVFRRILYFSLIIILNVIYLPGFRKTPHLVFESTLK